MFSIKQPLVRLLFVLIAFSVFVLLYVFSARAGPPAVILNLDKQAHKVFVEEEGVKREFLLEPGQEIAGVCSSDCWLQLEGQEEAYTVFATDSIMIEDGQFFLQEQIDPATQRAQEELPDPEQDPSAFREGGDGDESTPPFN